MPPHRNQRFWELMGEHIDKLERLQQLLLLVPLIPLGRKNNFVQKAHAGAGEPVAGRGQLHETLQTC